MFGVAVLTSTPPSERSGAGPISTSTLSASDGAGGGAVPRRERSGTGGGFVGGRYARTGPESSEAAGGTAIGWIATAGTETTGIGPDARGICTTGTLGRPPVGGTRTGTRGGTTTRGIGGGLGIAGATGGMLARG